MKSIETLKAEIYVSDEEFIQNVFNNTLNQKLRKRFAEQFVNLIMDSSFLEVTNYKDPTGKRIFVAELTVAK